MRSGKTEALAGVDVADTAVAARDFDAAALAELRSAGHDVDHAHQGIGAIGRGIGAAEHLDALDILNSQRDIGPVNSSQTRAIDRATVYQHLHAPGFGDIGAVIIDVDYVAAVVADHHAWDQTHQFRHITGSGCANQLLVDDRHAAGDLRSALLQARRTEYRWQFHLPQQQRVIQRLSM